MLKIEQDCWWDHKNRCLKFALSGEGRRIIFGISDVAIQDYFKWPNSKEERQAAFLRNLKRFEDAANRILVLDTSGGKEFVMITDAVCREYHL